MKYGLQEFWRKHGKRLTELAAVGGLKSVGTGPVYEDPGKPFGRSNRTSLEELEFQYLKGKADCLVDIIGDEAGQWLYEKFQEELERERKRRQPRAAA